jgi:pimeloyl-ACP methyl ester carboxylesterase
MIKIDLISPNMECYCWLRDGRKLGYAEYGQPDGFPLFLLHGIPGSRMLSHPDLTIAARLSIRLIVPERPGMGLSDFQPNRKILDWPADLEQLADSLGIGTFSVAGFSGGGPYAAACGYVLSRRLVSLGLISGVGPISIPGALEGMLPTNRTGYAVGRWIPWTLWRWVFNTYYGKISRYPELLAQMQEGEPESDRVIFSQPGIRQILIATFKEAFRQGTEGPARDGWLLSHPWGFDLELINCPVFLWQGEDDVVVTPAMGRYQAARLPDCTASFLPGEGHLIPFKYWENILQTLVRTSSRNDKA